MSAINKSVRESETQLIINLSEELKNTLIEHLSEPRKIRITLESVDTFDLSTVQILYAFMNQRKQKNLETIFETDFSQSIGTLLKHANINFLIKE